MELLLDDQGALYEQIARALKRVILEGRILSGSRLPSSRALARALQVSRDSIIQAYALLCAEQLAVARGGSGTRVANIIAPPAKRVSPLKRPTSGYVARMRKLGQITAGARTNHRYNLQYGEPLLNSNLFGSWRRKLAAAALRAEPNYPAEGGFMPLRRALADYLGRRRGVTCDPADILIVGGTQQAITLVARVLLENRDRVVIEDPHYHLAVNALKAHGARIVSVRTDAEGLVVQDLPRRDVRLAFVSPAHQFPSGTTMSLPRRMELLRWAKASDCWIFEDDYDAEFHVGSRPIPALRSLDVADCVVYVGTFSKTLFPSLRLGYIVCPQALRRDLFTAKLLDDLGSPAIEQAALATYLQSGQYEKHLRQSRREVLIRRRVVIDALKRLLGSSIEIGPHDGGMHFVVWLTELKFEELATFLNRAAAVGLGLYPVHPYYRRKPARPGLLIGYAGLSSGQLRTAVDLFAQCLTDT
jgi:GntR family transcriptional regulator / MocR family aminotransferase